jgi:hypothetical protein
MSSSHVGRDVSSDTAITPPGVRALFRGRNGFCHHAGMANERVAMYHSEFDAEQAEYCLHQAFGRYEDWGAERKLVELAKLHPCLKKKGRMSTVNATRGGRANARSRFKDNAANETLVH